MKSVKRFASQSGWVANEGSNFIPSVGGGDIQHASQGLSGEA